MPRFFFHIREKTTMMLDHEGIELPNLDAAYDEARESAREIMSQQVLKGERADGQVFVVVDEHLSTVLTFPFRLAIEE